MAFDEALALRVRQFLQTETDIFEKKMFGGLCILSNGNMICGIVKNKLMLRVGPDNYQKVLKMKNVSPMRFTGSSMKGFVFVSNVGLKAKSQLNKFLKIALDYHRTLPPKEKIQNNLRRKSKTKETPLSIVKNFGKVTLKEMLSMGISTLEQLKKKGFEETCRMYIQYYPERLNANAFLGIICSIEETVWTQATPDQKSAARNMAKELRAELGLPSKSKQRF